MYALALYEVVLWHLLGREDERRRPEGEDVAVAEIVLLFLAQYLATYKSTYTAVVIEERPLRATLFRQPYLDDAVMAIHRGVARDNRYIRLCVLVAATNTILPLPQGEVLLVAEDILEYRQIAPIGTLACSLCRLLALTISFMATQSNA